MRIVSLVRKNNYVTVNFDINEKIKLHYEVVVQCGLRKNDEFSESQLKSILKKEELFNLKNSALRIISRRPHSSFELRNKLLKKKFQRENISKIIDDFLSKGYLSDKVFAERFLEEGLKKKKGLMKIKAELFSKGISREIIDELINKHENDTSLFQNAKSLAERKLKLLQSKDLEPPLTKQKLYSYLNRKGYSSEIIRQIVDELVKS